MRGCVGHGRWDSHPIFWFLESGGKRIRSRSDLLPTTEWRSNDAKLDFDRAAPVPLAVQTRSKPAALAAHLKKKLHPKHGINYSVSQLVRQSLSIWIIQIDLTCP